jgi:DNA-directed RNA polymerase subunit RPC12/RpoP
MGSCHSIAPLIEKDKKIEIKKEKNKCMMCSYEISLQSGIYVKCSKCKILLHESCGKKYKSNTKTNIIFCPHCKYRDTLYSYDNNIYACKEI